MKTQITTAITILFSIATFAQQGINYKAVIKDGSGSVLSNQSVDVQFIIYEGAALTNNVYQESHTTNTDANGVLIVNIGEGSTSNVFEDVDWGNDEHWLNVQVDTGSGLQDMGTTQFMAVPYALEAKTVAGKAFNSETGVTHNTNQSDDFVFGSTQLDNDVAVTTDDSKMFFNKSKSAFRVGLVDDDDQWNDANIGLVSTAFGNNTIALGDYSFAGGFGSSATAFSSFAYGEETVASGLNATSMGKETLAQGNYSTATGLLSRAVGNTSFAMGFDTAANGTDAVSMGNNTKADASASLAIGHYNVGGGNPNSWVSSNPLFEVGNGTSDALRHNAFTVTDGGRVGINTNTPDHELEIISPSQNNNALSIESTNQPSGKDVLELRVPAGTDGSSQFIEMQQGNSVVAAVNSDGSAKFKSIQFEDNTVQTTAALIPIAYGSIMANATILKGSGNFTVSWNASTESYYIVIAGETNIGWENYITVVNNAFPFATETPSTWVPAAGTVEVTFRDSNGMAAQNIFTFITYKIN